MRKKSFKTREEVLQDTLNYFWGKPERKCEDESSGSCVYSPNGESEGCAVGRYLSLKLANELDGTPFTVGVSNAQVFKKLPKWMQALGQPFWVEMQILHDNSYFALKDKWFVTNHLGKYVDMSKITFPE
jgi:hypothetical protein